jgi:gliding motility-associated-like protein
MNSFNFRIIISLAFNFVFLTAKSQTLIMNEVSNGPAGNQEYVEFVVVSNAITYTCTNLTPPCIDIRGWIFDDNSGYHGTSGIATGAVRFSQDPIWSCVPLGTIILIYNNGDRNPAIPPDDLSMTDGNCTIIAPMNSSLFETNATTPGAVACSYPATGWVANGNWNNTVFANGGDCARIVDLGGCEVFSVCWGSDNISNLIYFTGSAAQKVYFFNNGNPSSQANWTSGSASPSPGLQTPGAPNNAANAAYIAQFNNGCMPITQTSVTAVAVNAGCTCNGSATASASGSIGGYTYVWYDASMNPIGQTSATATGLCAGVYNVIATSHIGCTAAVSVTITSSSTTSVTVNSQTVCAGTSAILTAIPSTAGGSFSWTPGGQTTSSISVNPGSTATYSVTYTLAGCSAASNGIVTVKPLPTVTVNSSIICSGQTATITATGATTYVWNTGSTTNSLTPSPTSTTNFTVTGTTNGCTNIAVSNVSVTPLPTITVNSPTLCAGQTTTLTANGATTYIWNTGSITNSLTPAPASTTSFTVTGTTNSCTNIAVSNISVTPLPTVTVNTSTICAGQTATLIANGATTYVWNTGSTNQSISDNPSSTANYTVVGELLGCVNTATASIVISANLSLSINTPTICSGQSATLSAIGATSYTWSNGAIGNNIVVSPSSTTPFSVTGTNGSCTGSSTTTVFVNPLPSVTVNSSTICAGQTASLTATGAASYTWNNGTASNTLLDSPLSNNTYTVTGSTLGCINTAIASVSVTPIPVITISTSTICAGQTATITPSGATTYTWNTASSANPLTVSPTSNTTYSVIGTTNNCSSTETVVVFVTPNPTISVNSTSICSGTSTTLIANGASTYIWDTGANTNTLSVSPSSNSTFTVIGSTLGCTNSAISNVSVTPIPSVTVNSSTICSSQTATLLANGANTYLWNDGSSGTTIIISPTVSTTYSVTGATNGCTSTNTGFVDVISSPIISVNSISICAGETTTLTASGANTYLWDSGSTTNTIVVNPINTITYSVTGTIGTCNSTSTANVIVTQLPILSTASKTICAGQSATIGVNGATSYLWDNNAITNTLVVSPNMTTTYTVMGTSQNCSSATTATVVVNSVPNISFNSNDTSGCSPLCVQFYDHSNAQSGTITNWAWNFGDGFSGNSQSPSHCFDNPGNYDVSLQVNSSNGCSSTFTHTNMIHVFPNPVAEFNSSAEETDILNPIIDFTNLSSNATIYEWNFGTATTSTLTNPSYTYNQEGVYSTTLIATNQYGCNDIAIHDVIVKGIFTFYAPNTFTPNDDNRNDVFLPLGVGWDPEKYQLNIFDRWGNNCFSTKEVGAGWDGKANHGSESAQIDTYTWKVDLTDIFGVTHKYIGRVTILR